MMSIHFYLRQTYPNRSLTVVCESDEREAATLRRHIEELGRPDIHWIYAQPGVLSLGALRNLSIREATGQVLCQWDDDDFYHRDRILLQVRSLQRTESRACVLGDHLLYLPAKDSLFWCDWYAAREDRYLPGAPQTIMWWRNDAYRYDECGPNSERSEDTEFLKSVLNREAVVVLDGCGYLYVYVAHGENTWPLQHHLSLAARKGLGADALRSRAQLLTSETTGFPFEHPLKVRDRSGKAVFGIGPRVGSATGADVLTSVIG